MDSYPSSSPSDEDDVTTTIKQRLDGTVNASKCLTTPQQIDAAEENVSVVVRVRPLSTKEYERSCKEIIFVNQSENVIQIRHPVMKQEKKTFKFDATFPMTTKQAELYNQIARPIVQNVIEGYNGTIFAYGQTGTGKTFTMEGHRSVPELKGIIPNSFAQIFSHISKDSGHSKFLVRATYLEIYNEEVRDLLGKETLKKLEIKEGEAGVYVKGLSSVVVKSEKDLERIHTVGKKNRVVGATDMNIESSRSHAIFTVTIECSTEDGEKRSLRMGKLNLVDLAGSERAGKSGAAGVRFKEGAKINLSLSCLGNVISALVDGKSYVPYRSSKLTRLLQDSLGGNSKTVMIANVGPADYNFEETMSTLRYADRAKNIKNYAHINEDPKDAILRQFEHEIRTLQKQLKKEDSKLQNIIGFEDEGSTPTGVAFHDDETLTGIKGELERQHSLSTKVKAETEHKQSTLFRLKEDVLTWKKHQEKKTLLEEKLMSIQKKIIVGGESLLDKSEEQEAYLQRCMTELNERRHEQSKLNESLTSKIMEKMASEERIVQLQQQHVKIKTNLKEALQVLKNQELADKLLKEEEKAKREGIENEISRLTYEITKGRSIIQKFIPEDALVAIESNMIYDDETCTWNLRYKDFTGNNLKQAHPYCQGPRNYTQMKDLSFVYKSLAEVDLPGTAKVKSKEDKESGQPLDYVRTEPVRTTKLITSEESLKLFQKHDLMEQPTFHFMNSDSSGRLSTRKKQSRKS